MNQLETRNSKRETLSPTVPTAGQSESDVLDVRAAVWTRKPLLREIYRRYFAEMVANFRTLPDGSHGVVVEIGGGSGNFKEFYPRVLATDIVPTVHCDIAADATALPFPDASIDNLVMQDVLHHIPQPLAFFAEAQRVLKPGGRVVMTEPYISPASRLVFALAHPEPVIPSAALFGPPGGPDPVPFPGTGAFASNQAVPSLLFYRDRRLFAARFPRLRLVHRLRRSLLLYPLSGGFSGPTLIPAPLIPLAWKLESLLAPLAALLAFRLVVVLEKSP